MAGTRSTNTMSEGLMALLGQVAQLMAAPDADLEALSGLQQQLLAQIKKPQQQAIQQYAQAGGVVPGMGGPPAPGGPQGGTTPGGAPMSMPQPDILAALMGGAGGGAQGGAGYKPWGVHGGASMPNPDELRRLVASESLA